MRNNNVFLLQQADTYLSPYCLYSGRRGRYALCFVSLIQVLKNVLSVFIIVVAQFIWYTYAVMRYMVALVFNALALSTF